MKAIDILWLMIPAMAAILISGCSEIDPNEKITAPKFHTTGNEGLWAGKSITHVPIITFTGKDTIDVRVPMKPTKTPIHYIEAIVLMSGGKEIDSKSISFNYDEPHAQFKLPDIKKGNYGIVVKCNTHDMWMTPVTLPPEKGK